MIKEIIILAKSVKHFPNYCIAGIDIQSGEWIRPISETEIEGSVPEKDITYEDNTKVDLLDIVLIDFKQHAPTCAQKENFIYNGNFKWVKIGNSSQKDVIKYVDCPQYIFSNTEKCISGHDLDGTSLLLVRVLNPTIVVKTFEKKKITINFKYNGFSYSFFSVGDSMLRDKFITYDDGMYKLGDKLYAVFSLTGEYNHTGKYYKMLASLFKI